MRKRIIWAIIFMIFFSVVGCSAGTPIHQPDPTAQKPTLGSGKPLLKDTRHPAKGFDLIADRLSRMTLDEKIGQLVITGIYGTTMTERTRQLIIEKKVGGVILFARNITDSAQLLGLINSIKNINSSNKIPIFISVDEEGGRVSRMPNELLDMPTLKKVGQLNNPQVAFKIGTILAKELNLFGFNMNFAPVLDINSNPNNPVIGDRSFGTSAEVVSELGTQMMKGIQSLGVIPVVKHFPGHGDTATDSHLGLPVVTHTLDRLSSFEWVPFKSSIDTKADAIMIAHILLTKIDPVYPASLSHIIVSDLLRDRLGFKGVVITDDLTMGAITTTFKLTDAAIRSLNAGVDILLVCHGEDNTTSVIDAIHLAIARGELSMSRINESVTRILTLKQRYLLNNKTVESVNVAEVNEEIESLNVDFKK